MRYAPLIGRHGLLALHSRFSCGKNTSGRARSHVCEDFEKNPVPANLGEKRDPGSEQVRVHLASKRNQEKCRLTSGIRRHRRSTLVI